MILVHANYTENHCLQSAKLSYNSETPLNYRILYAKIRKKYNDENCRQPDGGLFLLLLKSFNGLLAICRNAGFW